MQLDGYMGIFKGRLRTLLYAAGWFQVLFDRHSFLYKIQKENTTHALLYAYGWLLVLF